MEYFLDVCFGIIVIVFFIVVSFNIFILFKIYFELKMKFKSNSHAHFVYDHMININGKLINFLQARIYFDGTCFIDVNNYKEEADLYFLFSHKDGEDVEKASTPLQDFLNIIDGLYYPTTNEHEIYIHDVKKAVKRLELYAKKHDLRR